MTSIVREWKQIWNLMVDERCRWSRNYVKMDQFLCIDVLKDDRYFDVANWCSTFEFEIRNLINFGAWISGQTCYFTGSAKARHFLKSRHVFTLTLLVFDLSHYRLQLFIKHDLSEKLDNVWPTSCCFQKTKCIMFWLLQQVKLCWWASYL